MDVGAEDVLNNLRDVDEYEFEEFIADLWARFGWETEVTTSSQDRGIDIIANKSHPIPQKHVIQVKRWGEDNNVGGPDIREYSSLRYQEESVDAVIVVTTSSYTQQAEEAAENLGVKLVSGRDLYELLAKVEAGDLLEKYSNKPSRETVECSYCHETFSTETALKDHLNSEHSVECRYCSQAFPDEKAIREHLYEAHDRDELGRIGQRRVDQFLKSSKSE
jgi:hypothetical protein